MNSHIANLFLALQQHIATLVDTQDQPQPYFRFVDQDFGQLEAHYGDMRVPVSWPCVLIDIDEVSYKDMSQNTQTGIATIILRLGFPPFSSSSSITPAEYRQKALYYYDLEQILHLALQGQAPQLIVDDVDILADVFGRYDRISAKTEPRSDLIRVRTITYTIAFDDHTTQPATQLVPVSLDLNSEFIFPE